MKSKKIYWSSLLFIISIVLGIFLYTNNPSRKIASARHKVIFLGVDGLSQDYFEYAKDKLKLFGEFQSSSVHLAPFPSISDYSWNQVVKATDIYGHKGRIQHYEAAYFDRALNKTVDDPREYFRRVGQENHYYSGAFEVFLNPYAESLLYFPSKKFPQFEFDYLKKEILSRTDDDFTSALVASVDAISHTQADIDYLLIGIDHFVKALIQEHKDIGIDVEVVMVSDHGQSFDFDINEAPKELRIADVPLAIKDAGFNLKRSLNGEQDIAMPVLALANYLTFFFYDLHKRDKLADSLSQYNWFELAIYKESSKDNISIAKIIGPHGYAHLKIEYENKLPKSFKYMPQTANPLQLADELMNKNISSKESFGKLKEHIFPDSFYRIAEAFSEKEADLPDMIVTLKPEFRLKGSLDQFTKMYRTHGSLHSRSTTGIVTTTKNRNLPEYLRSHEILAALELNPETLFKENLNIGLHSNFKNTLDFLVSKKSQMIETGASDYSSKRIFGLMNRFVHFSQYVLDVDSMEPFQKIIETDAEEMTSPSSRDILSFNFDNIHKIEVFSPNEIGELMDIILENPDWKVVEKNPRFIQLKMKMITSINKLAGKEVVNAEMVNMTGLQEYNKYGIAVKNVFMKAHSVPYLLKRGLSFPEFDQQDETRDIQFAKQFEVENKAGISYEQYKANENLPSQLFQEVFKERIIVDDLYPTKIKTIYNLDDVEDITIVYIPGIYNSIFNDEIFQMGLDSIRDNYGLRVISPPVLSVCDSNYNGDIILEYLHEDIEQRRVRGKKRHKYFIWGYSKGAVDGLYALERENPEFVQENIVGFLSIASPLQGSSILTKTDLPIMLLELIGAEEVPSICRDQNWASKTITPSAAAEFFKQKAAHLAPLTRYYSISFESDIKNSHLWMQATKQIAKFGEANDGVVTVRNSKFPKGFEAMDFGNVKGDHLSGIVGSDFPQSAFVESLVLSLQKVGAFNNTLKKSWIKNAKYNSNYTTADAHRNDLRAIIKSQFRAETSSLEDLNLDYFSTVIKNALLNTPYEVNDFVIERSGQEIIIKYDKDIEESFLSALFSFSYNTEVSISTVDDLIDIFLEDIQKSGRDLLISEKQAWRNYPISGRDKIKLPDNSIGYNIDERISLRNLPDRMNGKYVLPMTRADFPNGISIMYDHQTPIMFREEYQMNYEDSSSLGVDNNPTSGWISHLTPEGEIVAKMSSKNSSIRLSTFAMRFLVKEFPKIKLKLKVTNNVEGADVTFGGSGKDDSAFQVWFTLRVNKPGIDRSQFNPKDESMIFGYYWGDKVKNKSLVDNEIYENYYSKKNFIIAVLPEAKQYMLGHKAEDMNVYKDYELDFYEHLKKAYPDRDIDNVEVLGITFQHDSNDTEGDSEAFFKYLIFE